ncbi:MAG: SCO family protein [Devosia sp.]
MALSPTARNFRIILWSLVVLAAVAATAQFVLRPPAAPVGVTGTPFSMHSIAGGEFANADLKGTPTLVFFGYTFCPDVCPTTLAELTADRTQLGLSAAQLRIVFVTVDPKRDTPKALTDYLGSFDPAIVGLYGDAAQTAAAKASFGVFSENGAADGSGNYVVSHTADVFLLDRDGAYQGTIAFGEAKSAVLAKIKRLVAG